MFSFRPSSEIFDICVKYQTPRYNGHLLRIVLERKATVGEGRKKEEMSETGLSAPASGELGCSSVAHVLGKANNAVK